MEKPRCQRDATTAGGNGGAWRFENYHDDGERGEGVFGEAPKTAGEAPALPGCRDNTKSASRTGQAGKIFGWTGIVRGV